MTVFGFIFTWTLYAVTFFISAFKRSGYSALPMAIFLCTCFAKTSVIWIPILFIGTSTQFRFNLVDITSLEKVTTSTVVGGEATHAVAALRKTERTTESHRQFAFRQRYCCQRWMAET